MRKTSRSTSSTAHLYEVIWGIPSRLKNLIMTRTLRILSTYLRGKYSHQAYYEELQKQCIIQYRIRKKLFRITQNRTPFPNHLTHLLLGSNQIWYNKSYEDRHNLKPKIIHLRYAHYLWGTLYFLV